MVSFGLETGSGTVSTQGIFVGRVAVFIGDLTRGRFGDDRFMSDKGRKRVPGSHPSMPRHMLCVRHDACETKRVC